MGTGITQKQLRNLTSAIYDAAHHSRDTAIAMLEAALAELFRYKPQEALAMGCESQREAWGKFAEVGKEDEPVFFEWAWGLIDDEEARCYRRIRIEVAQALGVPLKRIAPDA